MLQKFALKKLKITAGDLFYTTPDFAAVKAEKAAQVALQLEQHRANYNPVLNELLITHGNLKNHYLYQQQIFQHLTNSQIQKFCIQRALEERVFSYPRFIVAGGTFLSLILFSRSGLFITAPEPSTMYNLGASLSQGTVDFSRGWASNFGGASTACQEGFSFLSKTFKVLWKRF